jgi:hypothetical protein
MKVNDYVLAMVALYGRDVVIEKVCEVLNVPEADVDADGDVHVFNAGHSCWLSPDALERLAERVALLLPTRRNQLQRPS